MKEKDRGKEVLCSNKHKEVGMTILIWDKIKVRHITRVKVGRFIMIKELIRLGDITIINVYIPNNRAPKTHEKLTELKKKK